MKSIELQILLNSGVFVIVMIRYASEMVRRNSVWKLGVFVTAVCLANSTLMLDRYELPMAIYKGLMISLGFLVGTVVMAYAKKPKIK